jgi:hypothetical protein
MLDDETLRGMYAERGVPTEWQDVTPDKLAPAFKLWYRALPSPGAASLENLDLTNEQDLALKKGAEYAEWLIHDPVAALRDSEIIPSGGGDDDDDERERELPHISTMVVNHEKTLCRFIMHATVVASTNPKTVGITIVKEEAPGDDAGCP